jgi:hypothetical protein
MKYLGADTLFYVPDTDCSICGTRYQDITLVLECPYTTLMTLKALSKFTGLSIIDVNVGVVTTCEDLVGIELQTCYNMALVSRKSYVAGADLVLHPSLANDVMPHVDGFEKMQIFETR